MAAPRECSLLDALSKHKFDRSAAQQAVGALLLNGADLSETDEQGVSPLHMACVVGNTECVRLMLNAKANIDVRDLLGRTPLMVAAYYGSTATARLLVERAADRSAVDSDGRNAAGYAVHDEIRALCAPARDGDVVLETASTAEIRGGRVHI